MAQLPVTLNDGVRYGKGDEQEILHDVTLGSLTVGDIARAQEESEKVVPTPDGYTLVVSPTLLGLNLLRYQIKKLGKLQGPISLSMLETMTPGDLALLNREADKLDKADLKEVEQRGRDLPAP